MTATIAEAPGKKSLQLLLWASGKKEELKEALDALASPRASDDAQATAMSSNASSPPDGPKAPKRHRHGRSKIPATMREEKIVLAPDLAAFVGDARYVDTEVSYRLAVRPAEVYAIAIERPRYEIELVNGKTKSVSEEPPAEMINRGLLAPSALAHVLAMKWERHVPWSRQAYSVPAQQVDTLGGRNPLDVRRPGGDAWSWRRRQASRRTART